MTEKVITLAELADTYGRKPDTIWRKAKRIWPERKWALSSVLTEEEGRILIGDEPAPIPLKPRKPRTWTPESGPNGAAFRMALPAIQNEFSETNASWWTWLTIRQLRRFTFNSVCLAIVLGHAGLIWYDCAALWQEAGQIGGGLAFLFVLGCVLLATDASRIRTSATALWIVAGVDLAAWWVHYPVFTRQMTAYDIKVETGVLCAVICALSFFALVLYRDEKID